MPEYIDKALLPPHKEYTDFVDHDFTAGWNAYQCFANNIPAADVRPVVLCKDCDLSYETFGGLSCAYWVCVDCAVPEDFFCAYGQKREAAK